MGETEKKKGWYDTLTFKISNKTLARKNNNNTFYYHGKGVPEYDDNKPTKVYYCFLLLKS